MVKPDEYNLRCWTLLENYIKDIKSGAKIACKRTKQAIERFEQYKEKYDFREDKLTKAFKFFSLLRISHNKKLIQFELLDWQVFFLASSLGFFYKGTDKRVVKMPYLYIARKQGKSSFAAAVLLYFQAAEGFYNPMAFCIASSKKQAKVSFQLAANMVSQSPALRKYFKANTQEIKYFHPKFGKGSIQTSSKDKEGSEDGQTSVSFCLVDEYHAHKDSLTFDAFYNSLSQENSMQMVITTAGTRKDYPNFKLLNSCYNLLDGKEEDDSIFPLIFELDEGDDIDLIRNAKGELEPPQSWYKANPSLGQTITTENLVDIYKKVKMLPSKLNGFLVKRLNIYRDSESDWLEEKVIDESFVDFDFEIFRGKKVAVGIDLSINEDFSVVVFTTLLNNVLYSYPFFYFVTSKKSNYLRPGGIDIRDWIFRDGLVSEHKNSIKPEAIAKDIRQKLQDYDVEVISIEYDKFNADSLRVELEKGIPQSKLKVFTQSAGKFNEPTRNIEKYFADGVIMQPAKYKQIIKWMYQNVLIKEDSWNENIRPVKKEKSAHIDYVVAQIMSIKGLMQDRYYTLDQLDSLLDNYYF